MCTLLDVCDTLIEQAAKYFFLLRSLELCEISFLFGYELICGFCAVFLNLFLALSPARNQILSFGSPFCVRRVLAPVASEAAFLGNQRTRLGDDELQMI